MSPFSLDTHREILVTRVLPEYAALGTLAFAHLHGSLVSGYTHDSDLDVVLVWDEPQVPMGRGDLVARLDERERESPEAIDYRDVHLDRFLIASQDFEVVHYTLAGFERMIEAVRTGEELQGGGILKPLELAAGLRFAVFLLDPRGLGRHFQQALAEFPEHLKSGARHTVVNNRERNLAILRTHARRADWFAFQSSLVGTGRTVFQALFAAREVYWTGDKWRRAALVRFGFEPKIVDAYDRLWAMDAPPEERLAALERRMALVDAPTASASEA